MERELGEEEETPSKVLVCLSVSEVEVPRSWYSPLKGIQISPKTLKMQILELNIKRARGTSLCQNKEVFKTHQRDTAGKWHEELLERALAGRKRVGGAERVRAVADYKNPG